jgi:hypothetical protein
MRRLTTGEESGAGSRDNEPAGTKLGSNLSRGSNRLICPIVGHALRSGMDVKAYAASVGRKAPTVYDEVHAAKVAAAVMDVHNDLSGHFSQLVAIHPARSWLWPALVQAMLPAAGEAAVATALANGCSGKSSAVFGRRCPARPKAL